MSVFSDLVERLRTLVFRRQEERELEEELRFHVTMEAEQLQKQAGVSAVEAQRRSVMALGGIEQTKEDVRDARGTRWLEDSGADFKLALRSLRKSPGFATVAILTLAIGIGATTAVYSAVDAVLFQPLPYQEPGQLVRLYQYFVQSPGNSYVTPVHFLDYRTDLPSFEGVAAIDNYHAASGDIGGSDHPQRIRLLPVSSDYWKVLRTTPLLGRGISRDEETRTPVVVLSYGLWNRELGGKRDVIGQPFLISGRSYTVIGVMPESFGDPMVKAVDAWVPIDGTPGRDVSNSNNHYLDVIGRMRPGTTIAAAQAELDKLSLSLAAKYGGGAQDIRARLEPLKQDIVATSSRSLTLMLGAVMLVL
ncbi:MAG: ABC transporter permease, partial [Gemmatimonadaceae bacterium]